MLIEIDKIKVSDRIRKDFGNLDELADDIKENGLINPPVVTPDTYELIAGERRVRAMKILGYNQIEVRPMAVKDAEHALNLEISENETRKDFSKAERIDYARRLERVESLKARERQGERNDLVENFPQCSEQKTRDIVAEKLNIGSGKQYEKEKFIVENQNSLTMEDFAEWDEGKLSTNKAFLKVKAEKEALERKLISAEQLQQQLQKNQEEQNRLKNKISELIQQGTKIEIVTQEVDKPETLNLINDLQRQLKEKTEYGQKIYNDMMEKTKLLNVTMGESTNWQLTSHCSEITLKMLNFIKDMAKYDYMAESFNEIPLSTKKEYYRCIQSVKKWADNILTVIEKEQNIIEVE